MERLPVEVIGHILSLIGVAQHVVIASLTCRMWRKAMCDYLHTLTFHKTINILEKFNGRHKIIPRLRCLSLSSVVVSPLDLSLLLASCINIEVFNLDNLKFLMPDAQTTLELTSSTLKEACLRRIRFDNLIFKANSLEKLQLTICTFTSFELVGKGTLRFLAIEHVDVIHFDIGENFEKLEVLNVEHFQIMWENKFHRIIARSSSEMRRLKLWNAEFGKIVNIESISVCFPLLSHLALQYDVRDHHDLGGSYNFDNVVVLELRCLLIDSWFPLWVERLLTRCPKLKKLIIYGLEFFEVHVKLSNKVRLKLSNEVRIDNFNMLDFGMSSVSKLMGKYVHVVVQFKFIRNFSRC